MDFQLLGSVPQSVNRRRLFKKKPSSVDSNITMLFPGHTFPLLGDGILLNFGRLQR